MTQEFSPNNGSVLAPGSSQLQMSEREWQVVELIGCGKSLKYTANALKINVKTVSVHMKNIAERLGDSAKPRDMIVAWYTIRVHESAM